MRAQEFIVEAFDQPYPLVWEKSEYDAYDAYTKLDDGSNLSISFELESAGPTGEDEAWHVSFWRNYSLELTGEGDAQRIFATVLTAIQQFIKKENPARVTFNASKQVAPGQNTQSRARLYDRMVQRYASAWGYQVSRRDDNEVVTYELLRKDTVNEISRDKLERYLDRAGRQVDSRQERIAAARQRLSRSYEIYRAEEPTKIVHSFEADTPDEAKRYYNDFIINYESDVDYDLRLRRATGIMEVTMVNTQSKSKREHLDLMPNDGKPIPPGQEADYLGNLVADLGDGLELWAWVNRGTVTYYVFDTNTRTSQLGTTGRPYPANPNSFVIQGVYSGPRNQYRAADLYAFLILDQGLTLISDNKQSEGGYRVWQELEQRYGRKLNIHGFDTRTDEPVNVTTQDEPDTHVSRADVKRAGPKMKKELGSISRDLRFVASAR